MKKYHRVLRSQSYSHYESQDPGAIYPATSAPEKRNPAKKAPYRIHADPPSSRPTAALL